MMKDFFERFFELKAHRTTFFREWIGGLTTFAAMAYILAVNPSILATTGMDKGALITATAISAAVMTAVMALATNYPIALAPGMGLNAFIAFTLCAGKGIPWQAALGLVFYGGLCFLALSISGLRQKIAASIPRELKLAITAGIGFFIAFIGLKNGGIIVASPATLVTLGEMSQPGPFLVLIGIFLTGILVLRKIPGAIILVILLITLIGFFVPDRPGGIPITSRTTHWLQAPASLTPTFAQLDLGYLWFHLGSALPLVLAILFVDLFDNLGTLLGVSQRAGLLDAEGNLPKMGRAFLADAGAAIFGSLLGTSTVTSYIESAAGVEAGGRTGLSVLFTALCFLLALLLTPLILIVPAVATAPALVIVGIFMMQGLADLDFKDFAQTATAFVTLIFMPLTFSISEGIGFGLLTYVVLRVGAGRFREVGFLSYLLAGLVVLHELWGR